MEIQPNLEVMVPQLKADIEFLKRGHSQTVRALQRPIAAQEKTIAELKKEAPIAFDKTPYLVVA
jgi:hypothetical protein